MSDENEPLEPEIIDLIEKTMGNVASMPVELMSEGLVMLIVSSLCALRGMHGDAYTKDIIKEMIEDLDKPDPALQHLDVFKHLH
jgi:hypothetical protein